MDTMKYFLKTLCLGLALGLVAAGAEAAPKPPSAKSIECSQKADAQGLRGKDRRVFRAKCIRGES
jgi:hypothetical protein